MFRFSSGWDFPSELAQPRAEPGSSPRAKLLHASKNSYRYLMRTVSTRAGVALGTNLRKRSQFGTTCLKKTGICLGRGLRSWRCEGHPRPGTRLLALPVTPARLRHLSVTSWPCQSQQEFCHGLARSQDAALCIRPWLAAGRAQPPSCQAPVSQPPPSSSPPLPAIKSCLP